MAFVEKRIHRGRVRWRARYRDPSGRERNRSFDRRVDAERYLTTMEAAKLTGTWIDPAAGKVRLEAWSREWLKTKRALKPKTLHGYQGLLRSLILPAFGEWSLASIRRVDLDQWISELQARGLSASRIRQAFNVLAAMLDAAVEYEYIARNPCRGRGRGRGRSGHVELPKLPRSRRRFLSAEEVAEVAEAVAHVGRSPRPSYRVLVYVLAYGGMRWSELVALRREDVDLLRRRLVLDENAVEVGTKLVFQQTTKTDEIIRPVLPAFVCDLLAAHLHVISDEPRTLVFTSPRGGPLRHRDFLRYVWRPAIAKVGLTELDIHELRHTAASLLIAAGADPKTVQEQLGHRSIAITYDVYGHLLESHADAVMARLDAEARAAAAPARPHRGPDVVKLTRPTESDA